MQMFRALSAGAIAVAALALLLITEGPVRAQSEDPIRVGAVLAVTGPFAQMGVPEKKTLEVFVKEINDDGGLVGRPVELIVYDSKGDADEARTLATRLVEEDGIVAMIGGSTTGETLAMMPIFDSHEIPFVSLAGSLAIVDPVRPFVFKTPHTDQMACEKIFADLGARGLAKVALLSGTDDFGKSMRAACLGAAGAGGVDVVLDEAYDPDQPAIEPKLADIGARGAQAVVVAGAGEGPARVVEAAAGSGLALPVYLSHAVASPDFIGQAGAAAEGVRLPASAVLVTDLLPETDPQRDVLTDFKARYEEATGEPVSAYGGHAYDGLMLLVDAIKRAGSVDPFDLRNALESTSGFIGTAGVVNMTSMDHLGLDTTALRMLEIRDGAFNLVED